MPNLTSVGVTAGIPTSGTGTVSTIDGAFQTINGPVSIKPASTVPIATDPSMVVSLSPNSSGIVTLGQTTKSASVPVTLASDQVGTAGTANANVVTVQGIASMTKLLVTPDSVALPANQSVNVAQINAVTPLMGNGTSGTGSPRVTIASDNTAFSVGPNPYPVGATPITASATGTIAATTATLAANATLKTYIAGFSIRSNATAAVTGNATVTGTVTGTLNFNHQTAALASGMGITEERFFPAIPSSAVNTAIAVISPAPGTAGTISVTAWGYQL